MFNYQVTAQKPTAVTHCVTGNFTSPTDLNLIVSKCTLLEVHRMTPEGLMPLLSTDIYGRVSVMEIYRPPEEAQDLLFVCTERYKFFVIQYDQATGELVTRAAGDVQDRIGHPADGGHIGLIDPKCRLIGLRLYDGLFKVIPIDVGRGGQLREAFNIRQEELELLDMKFLHGTVKPTVAVLYQDPKDLRHIKTYEINLKDKEFTEGPWSVSSVDNSASILIPVPEPIGGVIIVGETTIVHHNGQRYVAINLERPTSMKTFARVDADGSRYILGDHVGNLYILVLIHEMGANIVTDIKVEKLGVTSIPSCISYLDNGVVFVGSTFGDSQLVRLNQSKDETGSFVQVLDTHVNLGPIVDFCLVDLDRQGQGQMVTCSGAYKDGSLRVIRNGVGINEQAKVELAGVKGLWSLRASAGADYDSFIALSFVSETRFLALRDAEMEEAELPGMQSDVATLHCGNVINNQFLQITSSSVTLVDCESGMVTSTWAPDGQRINMASANETQALVAVGGGSLVYLEFDNRVVTVKGQVTLEHEIACLDITSLDEGAPSQVCAVGLWTDFSLRVLALPNLATVHTELLGGETISRSVMFAQFEGVPYLLCGLGDGHFFSFIYNRENGSLTERKRISLGTQPIMLNKFRTNGAMHVFASSDRPTVVYSSNKKLVFSNVNVKEVTHMCAFNSESFPDSLALASQGAFTIGSIDEIQKLHKQSLPLGEMPRRIAYHEPSRMLAVLTIKFLINAVGDETESHFLRMYDEQTFEILSTHQLDRYENSCALITCTFADDPETYLVAGTAYVQPKEAEPNAGRILVFRVVEGKLQLVTETRTKGAVYCLQSFNGKLLAGINSKVQLYKWSVQEETHAKELVPEASHHGHILALYMRTRGDFIVLGDLMKSISVMAYKPVDGTIEEIAHDYNAHWMTDVEVLDDDVYLGAENYFNLFTLRRNAEAASDEERARLEVVGEYHLGEFINKMKPGSLVMRTADGDGAPIPTIIYATINGVIGVIASLPQEMFAFLSKVQANLKKVVKGVGGLKHDEWRSFSNERKSSESRGFIDGDLIESLLDLKRDKLEEVVKGLDITPEELVKRIEELSRRLK